MCVFIIAVAHNRLLKFDFDLFLQFCMLNFIIQQNVRRFSNVFCVCLCLVNLATNDRLPVHHVPFPVYPGLHVQL